MRKVVLACVIVLLNFTAATAYSASFDCKNAKTDVEKMICSNVELSKLDEELAATYGTAVTTVSDNVALKREQRTWLKEHSTTCGTSVDCLRHRYLDRITALSTSGGAVSKGDKAQDLGQDRACYRLVRGKRFAMCRTFERNLNQFCNAAPVGCERKIASEFRKDFSYPKWVELDPVANLDLIAEIIRSQVWAPDECKDQCAADYREQRWHDMKQELLERINNGKLTLSQARIDLNHNRELELVYRLEDSECPPEESRPYKSLDRNPSLMVLNEVTRKFDSVFARYLRRGTYDVVLYQGRAHLTTGHGAAYSNEPAIYDTVSGPGIGRFAVINEPVCKYEYSIQGREQK